MAREPFAVGSLATFPILAASAPHLHHQTPATDSCSWAYKQNKQTNVIVPFAGHSHLFVPRMFFPQISTSPPPFLHSTLSADISGSPSQTPPCSSPSIALLS